MGPYCSNPAMDLRILGKQMKERKCSEYAYEINSLLNSQLPCRLMFFLK
jgi:hypothetical protein